MSPPSTVPTLRLTTRGYAVSKTGRTTEELQAVRDALTATPVGADGYAGVGAPTSFAVYHETPDELFVPREFGLARFGAPAVCEICDGVAIDHVRFVGELTDTQTRCADAYMASAAAAHASSAAQHASSASTGPPLLRGVVNLPPGAGKTVITVSLIARISRKTLVVVNKDVLMRQWIERLARFAPAARIGRIQGKTADVVDRDVVVGMIQSLSIRDYPPQTFHGFGFLVVDECHHASAEVFSRCLFKLGFARVLGLSATPVRKDGLDSVFRWHAGPVVFELDRAKDAGVRAVVVSYRNRGDRAYSELPVLYPSGKPNYSRMINNVCGCADRTALVVRLVRRVLDLLPPRKVLVLSDRRAHLDSMRAALNARDPDVSGVMVGGMSPQDVRTSESRRALLATYQYVAEGYDNPELDTLVLASPKSDVVQVVGRVMRKRPEDRTSGVLIVDVADGFGLFSNQSAKRRRFYKDSGFEVSTTSCDAVSATSGDAVFDFIR